MLKIRLKALQFLPLILSLLFVEAALFSQPLPPRNLRVYSYLTYNRITWEHNPSETPGYVANYQVCRGNSSGATVPIFTVAGNTVAYNDSTAGHSYEQEFFYTVRAIGTDALLSEHSEEVMRFLPRAGATKIPLQNATVTNYHHGNIDPIPNYLTDTRFYLRSGAYGTGSSYGDANYDNRAHFYYSNSTNLAPNTYYIYTIAYRPDWWGNPSNRFDYAHCTSLPFEVTAEVPYEDNASSTYFNSSFNRVMAAPLPSGGVAPFSFSDSGTGIWRMRTPVRIRPATERYRNITTYIYPTRNNSPCRQTISVGPNELAEGKAALQVRVADELGNELESKVTSETAVGGWVTSFDVNFIVPSHDYNEYRTYWIYWGNSSANVPTGYNFTDTVTKTSQFEYSPWYSRKLMRGTIENYSMTAATRKIASPVPANDEQELVNVGATFQFPFYDNSATSQLYINSNGFLTFQPYGEPTPENTWARFTGNNSYGFIAPFWMNLMINDSVPVDSGVFAERFESTNARRDRYCVTWRANRHNALNEIYIFQTILYRSGDIFLRYDTLNVNGLSAPSISDDNPVNVWPNHTVGISANDGSSYLSITAESSDPAYSALREGTGGNVIHFIQSCHAWEIDTTFSDNTNQCSMVGNTTVAHYDSRIFDGRSSAPTWSTVEVDTSGSGAIDFYVRTATDFNFPPWDTASHLISANVAAGNHVFPITIPDERYVQYRAVFKESGSGSPQLDRVKFSVGYITIDNTSNEINGGSVSQGQSFVASLTFTNEFSNPVDAQVASLTFTGTGIYDFTRITPLPSGIANGDSAVIGFRVTVATDSPHLNATIYIDGYLEAGDGVTTLTSSQAISRSTFVVRQKAELNIDSISSPFDKVNKPQGGIPVTLQLSNLSPYVPLTVNSSSLNFSLGDYSWSPEYVFVPGDQGLFGQYYNFESNPLFSNSPGASRIDAAISFYDADWPNGVSPFAPNIDPLNYGVRWSGLITPKYSEICTFTVAKRGSVRLWVNGRQIINYWGNGTNTGNQTGSIYLDADVPVEIVMDYYKTTGAGRAVLSWSSPSLITEVVPQERLKPAYLIALWPGQTVTATYSVNVLETSVSGLAFLNATASGTNSWANDLLTEDFSADITDSWVIQAPATLSIGLINAPDPVYRGQANIPIDVEILNLGEADAIISSVPINLSLGTYNAIVPGETMPVTINGGTSKFIRVLVSIEETTPIGTAEIDAEVIGSDGNVGTTLNFIGASDPAEWTILAEKIVSYSDASHLLPLVNFVLPEAGFNYVYVKAENLAPLKEYAIRWFNPDGNEITAARTIGFADAAGNLFSELAYDNAFVFGLYTVKITNPVGTYSPAQTNFSIVTSSNVSGAISIPAKVSVGQNFAAYMELTNSGGAEASGMVPTTLIRSGTGQGDLLSGPIPGSIDLAGNSTATFTWNYTAIATGTFQLNGAASGFEAGSNKPVSVPPGRHDLLLEETFEDYKIAESLDGKNSGFGFSGPWTAIAGIQETIKTDGSMDYTSGMGHELYGGSKAARITDNNTDVLVRNLPAPITYPELYISMLVRFNGTQADNKFLALWFQDPGYGNAPNIGIKMNQGGSGGPEDFFVRTELVHAYHTDLVPGQTYLIAGRLSQFGGTGSYDSFELWVNPDNLHEPPPPSTSVSGEASIGSFSKIGFRSFGMTAGDSFDIAAFRIGKSWSSVTSQPLRSDVCLIQKPAEVTINDLVATPTIVFRNQKKIEVSATLQNHGEADARIDIADILQTPLFGIDNLASPSALPAILPGYTIATYVFAVSVNSTAPVGLADMQCQIRFEDVNNPVPTVLTDKNFNWTIIDTQIICARDPGFTAVQYIFKAGQTVYGRVSGLPNNLDVRMRFYETSTANPPDPSDVGVGIQTPLNTGTNGSADHFHAVPIDTTALNQWMIVVDDGDDTSLGTIYGIQYFEVVRPPQIDINFAIASSSCYVGDIVAVDFTVTNTATWPTNIRHYMQSYGSTSLYTHPDSKGYMELITPYPARGWHYDLDPGMSHTFRYHMKALSDSGINGTDTAIMTAGGFWRLNDLNDNSSVDSTATQTTNSITIFNKSFKIVPDGFSIPSQAGLLGEYYKSYTMSPPPMAGGATPYTRPDAGVNFDWGTTDGAYPGELGIDYFLARWTGHITPNETGLYTFYTTNDDGIRLWLNHELVIDSWFAQGVTPERSGTFTFPDTSPVPIEFEYFERTSTARVEMRWQGPATIKDIVPSSKLHHELEFTTTWNFGSVEPGDSSNELKNTLFNTGNRKLDKIEMLKPILRKSLSEFIPGSSIEISQSMPLAVDILDSTALNAVIAIPYNQPHGTYLATMTVFEDHRITGSFETDYPHRLVMTQVEVPEIAKAIVLNEIDFGVVAAGTTSAVKKIEYLGIGNKNFTSLKFHSPLPEIFIDPLTIGAKPFNASGSADIYIEVPGAQPPTVYTVYGSIYEDAPGGASEPFKITWEVGTFALALHPSLIDFGPGTPTELLPMQNPDIENLGELPLRRLKGLTTEFENVSQPYILATDNVDLGSPLLVNLFATESSSATIYVPGGIATGTYIGTFTWFEDQTEDALLDSFEACDRSLASFTVLSFYKIYTLKPTEDFGGVKPDTNKSISVGLRNAGSLTVPRLGFTVSDLSDGFDTYSGGNITLPAAVLNIVPGELRYFDLSAYVPPFHKHGVFFGTMTVYGDIDEDGFFDVDEPSHTFNLRIEIGDQEVSIISPAQIITSGNAAAPTAPESITVRNTGSLALTRVKTRIDDLIPSGPGTDIASTAVIFNPGTFIGSLVPTQSRTYSLVINIPFAQPPDTYTSKLWVWEDANNDNIIQNEEASASIDVSLEVLLVKELQTSPVLIDFGILARGDSATASFLIQNIGNSQLDDVRWQLNSIGAISTAHFSINPNPVGIMVTPPVGLPTNRAATFSLTIPGVADLVHSGNMTVYEDDNPDNNIFDAMNEANFPMTVRVQVVTPNVTVLPIPIDIPAGNPTGVSASATFTISNGSLINFKNLRYSLQNLVNGAHVIPAAAINLLPNTMNALAIGDSQNIEISVNLSPTTLAPGIYTGQITIWDDRNFNGILDALEAGVSPVIRATVNTYYQLDILPTLVDMGKVARNTTSAPATVGFINNSNVQLNGLFWVKSHLNKAPEIIDHSLINFTFMQGEPILPGELASAEIQIGPIDNTQELGIYGDDPQVLWAGALISDSLLLRCEIIPGGPQNLDPGSLYQEIATAAFKAIPAAPDTFFLSAYVCPATGSAELGFLLTNEAGIKTGYYGINIDTNGTVTMIPAGNDGGISEVSDLLFPEFGQNFKWYRVFVKFPYVHNPLLASNTYLLLQNTGPSNHAAWFDGVQLEKLDPDYQYPTSWGAKGKIHSPSRQNNLQRSERYFEW